MTVAGTEDPAPLLGGSPRTALRLVETGVTARDQQRHGPTSSTLSAGEFTVCGRSNAYGRRVSSAMENRAAVFSSQPQAVEVYQAGTWWAGELLGWRHDANGSCQVWVRVVLGGVEETAWTDLATLRLPERHLAVAAGQAGVSVGTYAPATQEMSVARHPSGRRARSADADSAVTAGLTMVPDLSVVPELPSTGGRRTAAETAQFASVGRRRAPETGEAASGGRRRAPETGESQAVGRRRAPEAAPAAGLPPVPPGRHRAPADLGRHRTADTGLLPVVDDAVAPVGAAASARPRVSAARTGKPAAGGESGWTAPEGLESELLTRPMRLSDHVRQDRRPRVDGSRRRV